MKQIIFIILVTSSAILTHGQIKPTKKTVKPQNPVSSTIPQKDKEITTQKAITENGKSVVLRSDGTWQFASVETTETPKVKSCDLTIKDAPAIRGLRLGMTREEVQQAFGVPRSDERSPFYYKGADILPNGIAHYTFYDSTLEKLDGFRGIRFLELDSFNDEVHSIQVKYSESTVQFTNEQFIAKLSESFNLPADAWSGDSLRCRDFELWTSYGHTLRLTNLLTSKKIEERQKIKREVFKP